MPNLFSKHLHLCFFKLKYPTILSQPDPQNHHHHTPSKSSPSIFHFNTDDSNSTADLPPPPDFASIFASQRFFFSSPGTSNSIIESSDTPPNCSKSLIPLPKGGVRVPKYSADPYIDFFHSMQEMIQSHQVFDVTTDWDYLHELLLCYLSLNPSHTHKYIVRAFTHLLVELLSSPSSSSFSSSSSSLSPPSLPCSLHNHRRRSSFSGTLA